MPLSMNVYLAHLTHEISRRSGYTNSREFRMAEMVLPKLLNDSVFSGVINERGRPRRYGGLVTTPPMLLNW